MLQDSLKRPITAAALSNSVFIAKMRPVYQHFCFNQQPLSLEQMYTMGAQQATLTKPKTQESYTASVINHKTTYSIRLTVLFERIET